MSLISVADLQALIQTITQQHQPSHYTHLNLISSLGHILAKDIIAPFDLPHQNLSAMDGFALAAGSNLSANTSFEVIGESCAGLPFVGQITMGQAVRIFTGAVVPDGCDNVIMQENTTFTKAPYPYLMTLTCSSQLGNNIRKKGEEITQGATIVKAGTPITPAIISLLATFGIKMVPVYRPICVGIVATGDELTAIGNPLTNPASIYNSNSPTLHALLAKLPVTLKDFGIIPDDFDQSQQVITQAINECDVIISSAGVSVGDYDYLTQVVEKLGKIHHYKVNMKPGKPFVFGEFTHPDKTVLYFGLPGNPLSTIVGCLKFVRPALWQLMGACPDQTPTPLKLTATCSTTITKSGSRQEFIQAMFQNDNGKLTVTPLALQGSHRVGQFACANCFIILPSQCTKVLAGDEVLIEVLDWA